MRSRVRLAIALVLLHLAINILHGAAHQHLAIGLSRNEVLFVWIVILAAPLVAAALLITKWRRAGGWMLAISMGGALVFGVDKHFIAGGIDNAFGVATGMWGMTFQVTAFLLAVIEAVGCWVGITATQEKSAPS